MGWFRLIPARSACGHFGISPQHLFYRKTVSRKKRKEKVASILIEQKQQRWLALLTIGQTTQYGEFPSGAKK